MHSKHNSHFKITLIFKMENHHFTLKFSRLFPSSCQFRTLPDVVESSITISKTNTLQKPEKITKKKNPTFTKHSKRLKCPPLTPKSSLKPNKKVQERCKKTNDYNVSFINQSSTSNSGWFSSGDETGTFFSLNSTSGDSFRVKSSRRFLTFNEMKSIDENGPQNVAHSGIEDPGREKGRSSFSSLNSFDTILMSQKSGQKQGKKQSKKQGKNSKKEIKGQNFSKYELECDQISTHIYYSNASDSETSFRRRRTSRNRRRMRKNKSSTVIEESYAVEKSSNDPRGDFRASMVEMILEKQMFGAEDLDRLLKCFLSLNAISYYGMIVDVFSEICETLFSN